MAKIVVVEDEVYMREELVDILGKAGYEVFPLTDFANVHMIDQIFAIAPDLIILDINLPYQSGFELCKALKAKGIGTILVLTARDKLQDELHAFGLGADDYLTKPCHMDRLLARINNLLRRTTELKQPDLIDGGEFLLDPQTFTFYIGTSSYLLAPNEGKILLTLLRNSPEVVSKKELSYALWETDAYIDENAILVNVTRLRKTLKRFHLEDCIGNVRGQGYYFRKRART